MTPAEFYAALHTQPEALPPFDMASRATVLLSWTPPPPDPQT